MADDDDRQAPDHDDPTLADLWLSELGLPVRGPHRRPVLWQYGLELPAPDRARRASDRLRGERYATPAPDQTRDRRRA